MIRAERFSFSGCRVRVTRPPVAGRVGRLVGPTPATHECQNLPPALPLPRAGSPLPAQTLFSDWLATDASNWTVSPANKDGGSTAFTGSGLGFSVGTPTAEDTGYRTLNTYAAPSTSSWSAQVDIHLASLGGLTANQFANLNLMVVKVSNPNLYNTSFALDRYNNGSVVRDIDTFVTTNGTSSQLTEVLNATTDATLRISYDAGLSRLTYAYDSDGAARGRILPDRTHRGHQRLVDDRVGDLWFLAGRRRRQRRLRGRAGDFLGRRLFPGFLRHRRARTLHLCAAAGVLALGAGLWRRRAREC